MNFNGLKNLFENYTGVQGEIEDAGLAMWFNEAQLDLAYDFGNVIELSITDNTPVSLDDCLRVVDCTSTYSVKPTGDIILDSTPATLWYVQIPEQFTGADQDQESVLPGVLHYLMAIFAASRYWDMESEGDSEESNHATKWMTYYQAGKAQAKSRMQTVGPKLDRWRIE